MNKVIEDLGVKYDLSLKEVLALDALLKEHFDAGYKKAHQDMQGYYKPKACASTPLEAVIDYAMHMDWGKAITDIEPLPKSWLGEKADFGFEFKADGTVMKVWGVEVVGGYVVTGWS